MNIITTLRRWLMLDKEDEAIKNIVKGQKLHKEIREDIANSMACLDGELKWFRRNGGKCGDK